MRSISKTTIAAGAAVLALGGAGAGLAAATSSSPPTPAPAPAAAAVPAALLDHFAVLRGAGDEAQAAEAAMAHFAWGINEQFGLNIALARRAPGTQLWVVPGSNGICLYVAGVGQGGCTSIANAVAGNLLMAGPQTARGLVPDGNPVVIAHHGAGAGEAVAVNGNTYVTEHGATSVDIRDSAGAQKKLDVPHP